MQGFGFAVRSPLEVGDMVLAKQWNGAGLVACAVQDILVVHSARTGEACIVYDLERVGLVQLSSIACRIVGGECVPLGEEVRMSKEMG